MELEIRPFDPARDDLGELTRLIRRAYASLAAMGLRYVGTWQDEEVTASRIEGAECYLAFVDQQLVGTVTLHRYEEGIPFYERDDVASFGQLCVEPEWQGRGIGGRLVDLVEARARRMGVAWIACDTAEHAHHLIARYRRRGYQQVDEADWDMTNYVSVILALELPA